MIIIWNTNYSKDINPELTITSEPQAYKAEDLLHCSPEFFVRWIKWCLRDLSKSRYSWEDIEIGHVRPVSTYHV